MILENVCLKYYDEGLGNNNLKKSLKITEKETLLNNY